MTNPNDPTLYHTHVNGIDIRPSNLGGLPMCSHMVCPAYESETDIAQARCKVSDAVCPRDACIPIVRALAKRPLRTMDQLCADRLADEVQVLVRTRVIDARSPAADALLDYRDPPASPRGDRIVELEKRRDELLATIAKLARETPYEEEQGNAAVLIAQVGTLRARVAELELKLSCTGGGS